MYEDTSVASSTSGPHTIVDQASIYLIYFLAIGLYDVSSPFNTNTNNTESGIFVSGQIELFVCFYLSKVAMQPRMDFNLEQSSWLGFPSAGIIVSQCFCDIFSWGDVNRHLFSAERAPTGSTPV